MINYEHHFIDSNVIIGYIIGWDNLRKKSITYFDMRKFIRYGSENVFNECEGVLARNKIWIKQFIDNINKECEHKSSTNYQRDLFKIIRKVTFKISHNSLSFKKVSRILLGFSYTFRPELIDMMKGNIKSLILLKRIDEAFKEARKNLIKIFKYIIDKKSVPQNLKMILLPQYQKLQTARNLHTEDIMILLDSHYISTRYARKVIAFITFDNGIIESKQVIEGQLGIKVFKPP